jgi:hypothetical protein
MRIAAVNAMLAAMPYMTAPFQSFLTPQALKVNQDDLVRWARDRAVLELLNSGSISAPPVDVPAPATRESCRDQAIQEIV